MRTAKCVSECVCKHAWANVGWLAGTDAAPLVGINTNVEPKLPWQLQAEPEASTITARAGRAPLALSAASWDFPQPSGHLLQSRLLCSQAVWLIIGQQWFVHSLNERCRFCFSSHISWYLHRNIIYREKKSTSTDKFHKVKMLSLGQDVIPSSLKYFNCRSQRGRGSNYI